MKRCSKRTGSPELYALSPLRKASIRGMSSSVVVSLRTDRQTGRLKHMHTHTRMRAHKHTPCTHSHTGTDTLTHSHSVGHRHGHTYMNTVPHTCTDTFARACTHTHHTCSQWRPARIFANCKHKNQHSRLPLNAHRKRHAKRRPFPPLTSCNPVYIQGTNTQGEARDTHPSIIASRSSPASQSSEPSAWMMPYL